MTEVDIDVPVRPWGNSLGIIIPADAVRALGLRPGEHVHIRLQHETGRNDASKLPSWAFVRDYDIDAILEEDLGG